jgi:glycosyl transferase family 25
MLTDDAGLQPRNREGDARAGPGARRESSRGGLRTRVVSLPAATARRAVIARQLDEAGLEWSFFDAHTDTVPELPVDLAQHLRTIGRHMTASEFGCFSSHWALLGAHAAAADDEVLLVMEDDAVIDPLFFVDTAEVVRLANRYGMIRFNGQLAAPSDDVEILGRRRVVRFKARVYGTLAYAVNARTARRLTARIASISRPIDVAYDRFWHHGVGIYCVYPFPAIESYKQSQIDGRGIEKLPLADFVRWKLYNLFEKARRKGSNLFGAWPRPTQ